MGKLFNMDSPVMVILSKLADLMILNIITMVACIPIVTAGASLTALHYVLLKMVRKEEGYIVRSYIKSFKENFKQATISWLILLLFIIIFIVDLWIISYSGIRFANGLKIALFAVAAIALMAALYIFPLLARFENTIRGTFKNALLMSILSLPKTVAMVVVCCLPVLMVLVSLNAVPVVFLLGISGPAYLCAMLYSGTFKKFEPAETVVGDEWSIKEEEEAEELPPIK